MGDKYEKGKRKWGNVKENEERGKKRRKCKIEKNSWQKGHDRSLKMTCHERGKISFSDQNIDPWNILKADTYRT